MRSRARAAALLSLFAVAAVARGDEPVWTPAEGRALVGTRAPSWQGLTWLQGGPLTLESLRGRPVLVRFWSDECPMCASTAPALNQLLHDHRARGLVVVAIHHPKTLEGHQRAVVARAAKKIGLQCPVAMDPDWQTLHAYGVGTAFQRFTSVSVLIDGAGVIRWVHDGGTLGLGSPAYKSLVATIEELLPRR